MLEPKQTATYRKWQRKLKDYRAKALIAARIFRLANGLPGDVKPVGDGVSELRIHHAPVIVCIFNSAETRWFYYYAEAINAASKKI